MKIKIPSDKIKVVLQNKQDIDQFIDLMEDNLGIADVSKKSIVRGHFYEDSELTCDYLVGIEFEDEKWGYKEGINLNQIDGHIPLQQFIDEYEVKKEQRGLGTLDNVEVGDTIYDKKYKEGIVESIKDSRYNVYFKSISKNINFHKNSIVGDRIKIIKKGEKKLATKELTPKNEKRVVHTTTQQQWDFVTKKLGYSWKNGNWDNHNNNSCVTLNENKHSRLGFYQSEGHEILSFWDWVLETNCVSEWNKYSNTDKEATATLDGKKVGLPTSVNKVSLTDFDKEIEKRSNDLLGAMNHINNDFWQHGMKVALPQGYSILHGGSRDPELVCKTRAAKKEDSFEDNLDSMLSKPKAKKKSINIEIETKQELNF